MAVWSKIASWATLSWLNLFTTAKSSTASQSPKISVHSSSSLFLFRITPFMLLSPVFLGLSLYLFAVSAAVCFRPFFLFYISFFFHFFVYRSIHYCRFTTLPIYHFCVTHYFLHVTGYGSSFNVICNDTFSKDCEKSPFSIIIFIIISSSIMPLSYNWPGPTYVIYYILLISSICCNSDYQIFNCFFMF